MARIRYNKNVNISRVVSKLVFTVLALYIGGIIIEAIGGVVNCTASGFYKGLTLLGWTVQDFTSLANDTCSGLSGTKPVNGVVTAVNDGAILTVIGVVGLATVVMEFVKFG